MTLFDAAALAVTALAALWDIRTGRIPNRLTLGALAGAFLAHAITGAARGGASGLALALAEAALGTLVCAAVPLLVFFLHGMGGGDVKLFAALGALCSAHRGLEAETYSFVVALLIAPAHLAYRGKLLSTLGHAVLVALGPLARRGERQTVASEPLLWFRLGPAIFAGTCIAIYLAEWHS